MWHGRWRRKIELKTGGSWQRGTGHQVSSRGSKANGSGFPTEIFLKSGCAGLSK
jgi:hypothetical protein